MQKVAIKRDFGRTHGAPYRGYGYVSLRLGGGGGGTSLGELEHNNNTKPEFPEFEAGLRHATPEKLNSKSIPFSN